MHVPRPAPTDSKTVLVDEDGAMCRRLPGSLIFGRAPFSNLVGDKDQPAVCSIESEVHQAGAAAPMGAERKAGANAVRVPRYTRSALLVSPLCEDHEVLGQIFLQQGWKLYGTWTLASALIMLRDRPTPVVITERDLPAADWKEMWAAIQELPQPPLLIVASRLADENLWREVLNVGAYDLLPKPFRDVDLLWVLENAWRRGEPT